jgi:Ser/Thr protein kinase RdoA (MazF antagonist)
MILKDEPLSATKDTGIFILDFEVSQHGSRAQDLAQCLAELWMVHHFYGAEAPLQVMHGFVKAYFAANTDIPLIELAFQIAIHFGVHIVVVPTRYDWPKDERLVECVKIGNGALINGYEKNREWFRNGQLDFLFQVI